MDVETSSAAPLQSIGAAAYIDHPSTAILMMSYHPVGDLSPGRLWRRGDPVPDEITWHVGRGGGFTGWNVMGFDRRAWRTLLLPLGFPEVDDNLWWDSMHLAAAANLPVALASLGNAGPHGLSEILYAYASTSADNGSAFGGLSANTLWFNLTTGCALFFGRYAHAIPVLAMAGALAKKKRAGASAGTFPTYGPMFATLVLGVILIVVLLEFFPALALGPIVEQALFMEGKVF